MAATKHQTSLVDDLISARLQFQVSARYIAISGALRLGNYCAMGPDDGLEVQLQCSCWIPRESRRVSQMAHRPRVLQLGHRGEW